MRVTERKYSIDEAAALLGVHRSTVLRLCARGRLGYYQIAGRKLIGEHHIAEFLRNNERVPRVRKSHLLAQGDSLKIGG